MPNTPHEIGEDFPGAAARIAALSASNAQFAELIAAYDEVNQAVNRAETYEDHLEQLAEVALRKKRAALKDEIARALAAG
jgi:hypothetical protein